MKIITIIFTFLLFMDCTNRKPVYHQEGNIVIQRYSSYGSPYQCETTIFNGEKMIRQYITDTTLSRFRWVNDSTFVAGQAVYNGDIAQKRIVLVNTDGHVRDVLQEMSDSFYTRKSSAMLSIPLRYYGDPFPDRSGENIVYVKHVTGMKAASKEAHIYHMPSKTDRVLAQMFNDNTYPEFDESPWSVNGQMIVYSTVKPLGNGERTYTSRIYHIGQAKVIKTLEGYKCPVWSPESMQLAVAKDHSVFLYDTEKDTMVEMYRLDRKDLTIGSMHWSPAGTKILLEMYTENSQYVESMIDVKSGEPIKSSKLMIADPAHFSWK